MTPQKNKGAQPMTLSGHLAELKSRVKIAFLVFAVLFVIFYLRANKVLSLILTIGESAGYRFFYITPYEMLLEALRSAFLFALCCAMPVIVYEIFAFVSPAVEQKGNKRRLLLAMLLSCILFALGALFCVKILFPFVLDYLNSYSAQFNVTGCVSVKNYVSLCISLVLILGIVFEIPIVTGFLGKSGLISSRAMLRSIRPAVVIILIVSAIITPPDVISMLLVAVPIAVVYAVGILVCKMCEP